jgi:serine/threonine protein kinase
VNLIQERIENGILLGDVNQQERLPDSHARRLVSRLIAALEYSQESKMVVPRDVKAENALLDERGKIRLIDFGLSHAFSADNPNLQTACGSPAYAAPEMTVEQSSIHTADLWSAGIRLYAMVSGELLFEDPGDLRALLMRILSTEPHDPEVMPSTLNDLLRRILTRAREVRIDLARIKAHP